MISESGPNTGKEVSITRIFNFPRFVVFKAWSQPEFLQNWYAPNGCTIGIFSFDFRVGGKFHHVIKNPAFPDCICAGVYQEIIEPEMISYLLFFSNEAGEKVTAEDFGMHPGWPDETLVTVTFEEVEGKRTQLTLHQTVSEALAAQTGALPSWLQMLDRLENEISTL